MFARRGIVRIVITLLLVYALLCFARSGRSLAEMERTAAELKGQRESLERERAALELRLLQQEDPARSAALARRELGIDSEETERDPLWLWK